MHINAEHRRRCRARRAATRASFVVPAPSTAASAPAEPATDVRMPHPVRRRGSTRVAVGARHAASQVLVSATPPRVTIAPATPRLHPTNHIQTQSTNQPRESTSIMFTTDVHYLRQVSHRPARAPATRRRRDRLRRDRSTTTPATSLIASGSSGAKGWACDHYGGSHAQPGSPASRPKPRDGTGPCHRISRPRLGPMGRAGQQGRRRRRRRRRDAAEPLERPDGRHRRHRRGREGRRPDALQRRARRRRQRAARRRRRRPDRRHHPHRQGPEQRPLGHRRQRARHHVRPRARRSTWRRSPSAPTASARSTSRRASARTCDGSRSPSRRACATSPSSSSTGPVTPN